jgi:adenylate cyclase
MSTAIEEPSALLTPRQLEVLELLSKGLTNAEIGNVLGIAPGTAKNHVAAVLEVLQVSNRTEAAGLLRELARDQTTDERAVPGFGNRPALAVLPLDNLGPPEDDYIADGLVEDLTTALAAWRWFPVIARNSTFGYKGTRFDVRQVSRELGARYVLEGSARRAGNRLRVHVQLIDGHSGEHHFAQRYDRIYDDLFEVQDEIVNDIVGVLEPALAQIERLRARRKPPEHLDAWGWLMRGLDRLWRQQLGDPLEATALMRRAIEAEPEGAAAWAALSMAQSMWSTWRECDDVIRWRVDAEASARRAIELDPMDFSGHVSHGAALGLLGRLDDAIGVFEHAADLNPSSAMAWFGLGTLYLAHARQRDAIAACDRALRLSPRDPMRHHYHGVRAAALLWIGDFDEALVAAQASVAAEPSAAFSFRPLVAAALGHLGRFDEARAVRDEILAVSPAFDLAASRALGHADLVDRVAEGFQRFGWEVE